MREIGRGPPVVQLASSVEECALIIEAVADLMTDGGADRSVVHHSGTLRIEVGWLQYRRREIHRIHRRKIYGIDRLRRHDPLGAIDRLSKLGEVASGLET